MPKGDYTAVSRPSSYGYDFDEEDSMPLNPTIRITSEHQGVDPALGEVHALSASVHTTHANVQHPDRRKTYLIATYTSVLSLDDVRQEWFVPYQLCDRDQPCNAQTYPLRADNLAQVDHVVQEAIEEAYEQGAGRVFFDDAPVVSGQRTDPWSRPGDPERRKPSPTSPHTDAGVTITLHGTKMENSPPQRLVHEGEGAEIFRQGGIDEFAVTCQDIGDLTAVTVTVDRNGNDWSSSMWKLDKIVVTCLQSHKGGEHMGSPSGENVDKSIRTANSSQWHFVPAQQWIGPRPPSTRSEERDLREKLMELEYKEEEIEQLRNTIRGDLRRLNQIRGTPWTVWDPREPLRIEIGQEAAEPDNTRNHPRKDRNGKKDRGLCNCECCCRSPIATLVVFVVLLVILLAVVARSYAVYTRELAGAGGAGGGDLPGQVGAPGGSPGQYTHGSGDSSHECEVTPQLTCTCDGTPIIQSCSAGFGGAMMPWSGVRQASLAEICTQGISLELEQGSFSITAMLEHVNLLIGITQPAATGSGSAFNG